MNDIVIKAENLGKKYRIGGLRQSQRQFRAVLVESFAAPLKRLRSMGKKPPAEETIWALRGVSFGVKQGEVVGIIGRNGAGKTTLLKILSRITAPTEGGADIRGRVGSLLEVGTGFHPELTGRENIYLNGAILGMRKAEIARKFDEIVDFSGVKKFIDTPVKRYSSGMKVRLAFSVAAHLDPEILLVDEVLAVGDVDFQKKCLGKMGAVAKGGRTVLFVSHNMTAVAALCQRTILIEGGRLTDSGPSAEVIDRYLRSTEEHHIKTSIADTKLRSGSGVVRFKNIQVLDSEGNPTTTFCSGQQVRIKFDFDLGNQKECAGIVVGVTFRDQQNRAIFMCRTDYQANIIDELKVGRSLICIIPRLPLYPGDYFLTAAIHKGGIVADFLERVIRFHVGPGDFYGSGRLTTSTHAKTLVTHEWKESEPA